MLHDLGMETVKHACSIHEPKKTIASVSDINVFFWEEAY